MSRRSLWNTLYIYTSCFSNVACTFKYSILETDGGKSLRKMLAFKNLMASERSHINIRSLYSAKTLLLTPMPQFRERISDHISDFRNCKQRWDFFFFRVFSFPIIPYQIPGLSLLSLPFAAEPEDHIVLSLGHLWLYTEQSL